jgi:hypothetical protein
VQNQAAARNASHRVHRECVPGRATDERSVDAEAPGRIAPVSTT